jgi:hypothetical protein
MNTLSSKSIQTEKAEESLILTEQEERKTRYFAPRTLMQIMAIRVVEFSNGEYKIRKIFA